MEIVQIVHQQDIGPSAWSNHPNFTTDAEMLGGVDGGHLDGCHGSKTLLDGMPQDAVHMAFGNQRGGLAVISAQDEMTRFQVALSDSLNPLGDILPGRTIAQHGLHALPDAFHRIFRPGPFVIIFGSAGHVGMEGPAQVPGWIMPADHFPGPARGIQLGQHLRLAVYHAREVHHFTQANDPRPVHRLGHLLHAEFRTGGLEAGGGWHAGWHLHPDMHRL